MIPSLSRKFELVLGAAVLIALAVLVWIALQIRGVSLLTGTPYHLLFDNAVGLVKDNPVTIAGVKVGTVSQIEVEGKLAKVTVYLNPKVKLYPDAKSAIRAKSLLGEKYVSIDPGTISASPLSPNATLTDFVPTVDIDQVIREVGTVMTRMDRWTEAFDTQDTQNALAKLGRLLTQAERTLASVDQLARQSAPAMSLALSKAGRVMDELLKFGQGEAPMLLTKLGRLVDKVDQIDERKLREFLQLEGIRIRILENSEVRKKVEALAR